MSETPETDANEIIQTFVNLPRARTGRVKIDFAKKLELERDKYKQHLNKLIIACESMEYWYGIAECVCSQTQPIGACLRCDVKKMLDNISQLKSQLTKDQGCVTISRNGYVQELEEQRDRLKTILKDCLYEMPVGYIPNHTIENLPAMIQSQAQILAEASEYADRLVEHKDMVCLPADLANLRAANAHFAIENEALKHERDGWREAAYSLGEAIPASWDDLQPPAQQLRKFKEMTALENEKIKELLDNADKHSRMYP